MYLNKKFLRYFLIGDLIIYLWYDIWETKPNLFFDQWKKEQYEDYDLQ